jgi:hypothetical protein
MAKEKAAMKAKALGLWILLLSLTPMVWADTIVLHDGASYSGQFTGAREGSILFTDNQGVEYRIPIDDVQSLVFTATADIVSLRDGRVYTGKYTGTVPIGFTDASGIDYQFPTKDVASLVFSRTRPVPVATNGGGTKVIPYGTDIVILTNEAIDSQNSAPGQLFSATIGEDVVDASGGVGIPQGSKAKMVVRNITSGGMVHSPEIVLDLYSVTVGAKEYRVVTNDADVNSKTGVGGNKRTLEFGGGGAAIGGLLGGIFGGGKGAGIGLAAGAGGGLLTQIFTRVKRVQVPAETTLRFRLDRTLVLRYQN